MQVRDIAPTSPADTLIVVGTKGDMVELQIDNYSEMLTVYLNTHKTAVLMVALSTALAMIARETKVQPCKTSM